MEARNLPFDWRLACQKAFRADYLIVVILASVVLLVRWPYLGDLAPDYDEQLYHIIGQRLLLGDLPFVDLWDRKPFGLFLIFAFASLVAGGSVWGYQFLACGCALWSALLIRRIAKPFAGERGGATAALLYILYLSAFGVFAGQSEVFYTPLLLLMLLLAIRVLRSSHLPDVARLSMWIMVLGGLCLQVKYTVLPQCVFFGLFCLWRCHVAGASHSTVFRYGLIFASLGLLPTLSVAVAYLALGQFDAFFFANFSSIFFRGPLTGALKARYELQVGVMLVPLLIAALAGAYRAAKSQDRFAPAYLVILLWTVSSLAGALMVGNIYIHYFAPVLPGLLLLAAPGFAARQSGPLLGGLVMLIGLLFYNPLQHSEISVKSREGFFGVTALARPFLTEPRNCLYVFDGPTALYTSTGSCLPTRYIYPDHLSNEMEAGAIGVNPAWEVSRILHSRPGVIITASRTIVPRYNAQTKALVDRALARDYVEIDDFYYFPRRLNVFVRKDLCGDGARSCPRGGR
ncbi:hypothetical protein M2342_000259 [Sphingobium sp. B8D3A]|nr:hypothetical protein [Sphingobium sp. B8D3A]